MKNLRNYISSNKEQFNTAKAPDAWNEILAEIKPEKKKRGFIYWSAAAAVLLVSGLGYLFSSKNYAPIASMESQKEVQNVPREFRRQSNTRTEQPTKEKLVKEDYIPNIPIPSDPALNVSSAKVEKEEGELKVENGSLDQRFGNLTIESDLDGKVPMPEEGTYTFSVADACTDAGSDVGLTGLANQNTYQWTEIDHSEGEYIDSYSLFEANDRSGNGLLDLEKKSEIEGRTLTSQANQGSGELTSNNGSGKRFDVIGDSLNGYFVHDLEPYNYEEYEVLPENHFLNPISDPFSTFSIDVDGAAYSICRRYINGGQLPPKGAVKAEEITNYFEYDYPGPTGDHPFAIYTELAAAPWSQEHDLLKVTIKGEEVDLADAPANNLVFLVDVSGSMNSPDKLGLLKESFVMLANEMRSEDKITIVTYAGDAGVLLPTTTGRHKDRIIDALGSLTSGGGTNGSGGIKEAYRQAEEAFIKDGNNRIILATDGDFNVGVSSDNGLVRMIEKKRESGIFLSVLGFGTGNLQSDKMEKLSQNGNGNWNYIDNVLESNKVLIEEMGGTLITIAKDMKLQLEFNPQIVKNYRLIGYENRMLEKEDFENDAVDAGDLGAGLEVTAFYEIERTDEVVAEIDGEGSKYVQSHTTIKDGFDEEMVTVNIRYKEPDGKVSKLITKTQSIEHTALSDDFFLACAATEFALVLRESEYAGVSRLEHVKKMLEHNNIKARDAYTKEFYELVLKSIDLKNKVSD